MRPEAVKAPDIEKTDIYEPGEVLIRPIPRVTEEQKIANIRKEFKIGLKRDLTEKELALYLFQFNQGITNYWKFLDQLKKQAKNDIKSNSDLS